MGYTEQNMPSLPAIADAVIAGLSEACDPFETPTVVCHNARVIQWCKAYYLKTCGRVLMNVRFETLGNFINERIKPDRKRAVLDRAALRAYLLKALPDTEADGEMPAKYIYKDGKLDGVLLFELADKLAALYLNYELYDENVSGWEAELLDRAAAAAAQDGRYTPADLFEKSGVRHAPDGPVYVVDNSFLTPLYQRILEATAAHADVAVFHAQPQTELPVSGPVISAPSVLREVEAIHSEICKLVQNDPSVRFNDILVYAPDINVYTNAIRRVFRQDDRNFLSVPFRVIGEYRDKQDMKTSLQTLFEIASKRYFTRTDFFRFVKNPLIKRIREITDEDVETWMDAIDKTNTHRNGKDEEAAYYTDDWDYLKKRLLLSLVVSDSADFANKTELGGKDYLPFSSISLDAPTINKMIDMIDLLQRWCAAFPTDLNEITVDAAKREELQALLDAIYSIPGADGEEKNYLYREVLAELERVTELDVPLPANTLLRLLMSAPDRYCIDRGDIFTNGVNFMSLRCDDVVSAKHVFVMGMSSAAFPRVEVKSELDGSENRMPSQDVDRITIRNVCANAEQITFSYVNCDLQKDEPFYLTSLVKLPDDAEETRVPLDETRAPEELFTKREFRSCDYYYGITAQEDLEDGGDAPDEAAAPLQREKSVTLRDMKKFLEDTFIYKFNKLLGKTDDEESNYEEYEPLEFDRLDKYSAAREYIAAEKATGEDVIKEGLGYRQKLPLRPVPEVFWGDCRKVREILEEDGYERIALPPLQMQAQDGGETLDWQLLCNLTVCRRVVDGERWYFEPVLIREVKPKHWLPAYLYALMDAAALPDGGEYTAQLLVKQMSSDAEEISEPQKKSFIICPERARQILNELYRRMTDYRKIKFMRIDFLDGKDRNKSIFNMSESENPGWRHFKDRRMVQPEKDFGYDPDDSSAFADEVEAFKELILF